MVIEDAEDDDGGVGQIDVFLDELLAPVVRQQIEDHLLQPQIGGGHDFIGRGMAGRDEQPHARLAPDLGARRQVHLEYGRQQLENSLGRVRGHRRHRGAGLRKHPVDVAIRQRGEHALLRIEMAEHRGGADAGRFGNGGHGGLAISAAQEQLLCRVENGVLAEQPMALPQRCALFAGILLEPFLG